MFLIGKQLKKPTPKAATVKEPKPVVQDHPLVKAVLAQEQPKAGGMVWIKDIFTAETMGNPDCYPYKDGRFYRKDMSPAGAVEWSRNTNDQTDPNGQITHLHYLCPCGCGAVGNAPVNKGGKIAHAWEWDGNEEFPTLNPSIQMLTKCRWHGFLRKGVWISV